MNSIRKRPLGKTGLEVSEVGLGGVFISERKTARDEAIRIVHRALELGVNYFDTAPLYGNSQDVLGEALDGRHEQYVLGTKCGRWDWRTGPYRDLDAFKRQFEQSLIDLRRDSVEVLYIHEADWSVYWMDSALPQSVCHVSLDERYDYASAPVAEFLRWAKAQGMARHLGISGNNARLLAKVLREIEVPIEVALIAFQYSLIWRNAREHFLPAAKELGVGVVLGAPLQQGRLALPHPEWLAAPNVGQPPSAGNDSQARAPAPQWMDEDLRARFSDLYRIQAQTRLSLAELSLRFILADPDFATVIPGAATVEQLEENVRCSEAGPLPPGVHGDLVRIGRTFDGVYV